MSIQAVPSVAKTGYPLLNYTSLDSVAIDSLLFKISQAQKKISYSGTLERETSHAGKPMLLRWQVHHWAPSQTLVHFLEPEALQNTVIYNDGKVFKTTGDSHVARSMRRSGISRALQEGQLLEEIELLSQNYVISLQNGADYIGRKVLELKIEPKRNGRPSYFAKVDAEMGVLLETRRMPANIHADSLVQVSRFITIRYGFPDDSLKYQNFTTVDSLRQRAGATCLPVAQTHRRRTIDQVQCRPLRLATPHWSRKGHPCARPGRERCLPCLRGASTACEHRPVASRSEGESGGACRVQAPPGRGRALARQGRR